MPSLNTKKKEIAITPPTFKKQIGAVIKDHRKAAGLTQVKLAEIIGIAHYQVSRYERGKDAPTLWIITLIAKACEVPIIEILKEILT